MSYTDTEGYVLVWAPQHPNAQTCGYIRRGRLVLSQDLKRSLKSFEIAHHINGDRADDRLENLKLKTPSQHSKAHRLNEWRKQHPEGELRVCRTCGKTAWTMEDLAEFAVGPRYLFGRMSECKPCFNLRKKRERKRREGR